MIRADGRSSIMLRRVRLVRSCLRLTAGSALIRAGDTQVLCAATIQEKVPPFLRGTGKGWVTAEYSMLPGAVGDPIDRHKPSGRGMEIQRLIGRSLRAVTRMELLGERTIQLDCDVLDADGGTRTAAITGAFVALSEAVDWLLREGRIAENPLTDSVAAISVGRVDGRVLLDLCHQEDSAAEVDLNLVATGGGRLVEVQGTAEKGTFSAEDLREMVRLGLRGIRRLTRLQRHCLDSPPRPLSVLLPGRKHPRERSREGSRDGSGEGGVS
jgi:ribonuclease PH